MTLDSEADGSVGEGGVGSEVDVEVVGRRRGANRRGCVVVGVVSTFRISSSSDSSDGVCSAMLSRWQPSPEPSMKNVSRKVVTPLLVGTSPTV